jgi:hypothetical protein
MPPVPGWLVEGLWVVSKETGELFKVTKVTSGRAPDFAGFSNLDGSHSHRTRLDYIHTVFFACNFFSCDDCRKHPGILTICDDCVERKIQFEAGPRLKNRKVCGLPKLCKRKFVGGYFPLTPPVGRPRKPKIKLHPTRFEREDVI